MTLSNVGSVAVRHLQPVSVPVAAARSPRLDEAVDGGRMWRVQPVFFDQASRGAGLVAGMNWLARAMTVCENNEEE